MALTYELVDRDFMSEDVDLDRVWQRNIILAMELEQLKSYMKSISPGMYDDAIRLAESNGDMTLRHGGNVEDGYLRCLQSIVIYGRKLYKKDCRAWLYKSHIRDFPDDFVPLNSPDGPDPTTLSKRRPDNRNGSIELPFKLMCGNDRERKPVSTPELPVNQTPTVFIRTIKNDRYRPQFPLRAWCSRSESALESSPLKERLVSSSLDQYTEMVGSGESYSTTIINDNTVSYNLPTNPLTNTAVYGWPPYNDYDACKKLGCTRRDAHWVSPSTTPSHLSLANVSESSSYTCVNTNNHCHRSDHDNMVWIQRQIMDVDDENRCGNENVVRAGVTMHNLVLETEQSPPHSD